MIILISKKIVKYMFNICLQSISLYDKDYREKKSLL